MLQLNAVEARVVATLVEKDRSTPDSYPLTTNSLVAACNQKTSRDPVMALTGAEVDAALLELRQRGMVRTVRGTSERTFKHRHTLAEALDLDDDELACLALLVLRGAQTPGELRIRSERYVTFADLGAVEATLHRLAEREEALVRSVGRGPGQSQDRWIELVSEGTSGSVVSTPVEADPGSQVPAGRVAGSDPPVATASGRRDELETLKAEVQELRELVDEIRSELGMAEDSHQTGVT